MDLIEEPIKAPSKGRYNRFCLSQKDGKEIDSVDILADRDIEVANIYEYFVQTYELVLCLS